MSSGGGVLSHIMLLSCQLCVGRGLGLLVFLSFHPMIPVSLDICVEPSSMMLPSVFMGSSQMYRSAGIWMAMLCFE